MIYDELSSEWKDRLRAAFDRGFAAGSGGYSLAPDDLTDLMDAVQEEWFCSLETMREAERARYALPGPEAAPIWLRAEWERQAALGDAKRPPELEAHHAR